MLDQSSIDEDESYNDVSKIDEAKVEMAGCVDCVIL